MTETEDYDKSAIPTAHKTSHENGGTDEILVTGLSGLLADPQTPASHNHDTSYLLRSAADYGTFTAIDSVALIDGFLLEDSSAAFAKKYTTVGQLPFAPLTHKTVEDAINGLVFVDGSGAYSARVIGVDVQAYLVKGTLTAGSNKIAIGGAPSNSIIGTGVSVDVNQANLDHGSIGGLVDDDHVGYARLAGRSGGTTQYGGIDSGDDLSLISSSHATLGDVTLNTNLMLFVKGSTGYIGFGTNVPGAKIHVKGSTDANSRITIEATDVDGNAYLAMKNDARTWLFGVPGWLSDNFIIYDETATAIRFQIDTSGRIATGVDLTAGQVYRVAGNQVVGARYVNAAIDDAVEAAFDAAYPNASNVLKALQTGVQVHGLMKPS